MRVKLRKDWNNGTKVIPKGTEFFVTKDLGRKLIADRVAKEVIEMPWSALLGKQEIKFETKDEYLTKKKNGNNRNS